MPIPSLTQQSDADIRLQKALGMAVALHLALAMILPDLPKLLLPSIDRGRALSVFLRSPAEEVPLDQNLNNPGLLSDVLPNTQPHQTPARASSGEQTQNSEFLPRIESEQQDRSLSNAGGDSTDAGFKPSIFITRGLVALFSEQEAVQYAEQNPDELARFSRSFTTPASNYRRNRMQSYTDRFGDYYVRNSTSVGDICFIKQNALQTDEFSTHTVMFFECGEEPIKLSIDRSEASLTPPPPSSDLDESPIR